MKDGWQVVPLGDVLIERKERVGTCDADNLPLLGVSNRAGLHASSKDRISDMSRYLRVERDWFAYNPMRINVGSIGWAESESQTGVISPDYVVFSCTDRVLPRLVHLFLRSPAGLRAIGLETAGSVRERLYFEALSRIRLPLPSPAEQLRIIARIEGVAAKIEEAQKLREEAKARSCELLLTIQEQLAVDADRLPMRQVAPLLRRPIQVDASHQYAELGVRSFGKGTFHKTAISGAALGTKRIFRIEPGDLVFNNVFAWEGAVAVAQLKDAGRVGSHRFLTCVPKQGVATAEFLCAYFLSQHGLEQLGEASPGGAGRNRTLGIGALMRIPVPVPPYEKQVWFSEVQRKLDVIGGLRNDAEPELKALLPAVLGRAFKGEL